ncbi:MAG: condensation domain-containing protein [Gammaproteobacteria bacterium]|nr:condensation domain-containing protein [Gammaproteobacteria bacterium]
MSENAIAVVGMSCRFPGARNYREFWANLCAGKSAISKLDDLKINELFSGNMPNNYVPYGAFLEDIYNFDADFFDIYPREAIFTDPQHRIFLEEVWSAFEDSAHVLTKRKGKVGIYASCGFSLYSIKLFGYPHEETDKLSLRLGLDKDYLANRVAYKLNLKGPAINVQTACSSSLVAVSSACDALLNYSCDMAVAGGVAINNLSEEGYYYSDGSVFSKEGLCRPFDKNASGTIFSSGAGVVILKRLEDAVADGDFIKAIIPGWAVNNDGRDKVGFSAPSVSGQVDCIQNALSFAEISPQDVRLIETHGTGTILGDSIEIEALKKVFKFERDEKIYLGAIKANIGHCDVASGISGLIKQILTLQNKKIPPVIHFSEPNPDLALEETGFQINTELVDIGHDSTPIIGGVSSFGIGGTNAHVVLCSYNRNLSAPSKKINLPFVFSAKNETSLVKIAEEFYAFLEEHKEVDLSLADLSYTLALYREHFKERFYICGKDFGEVKEKLKTFSNAYHLAKEKKADLSNKNIIFIFPGQGMQNDYFGKETYKTEDEFKRIIDECIRELPVALKKKAQSFFSEDAKFTDLFLTSSEIQPMLFIVMYAFSKMLVAYGVSPKAMLGHSLGEYVACTLSGGLQVKDTIKILVARGQVSDKSENGLMCALPLKREKLESLIEQYQLKHIELGAENAPNSCVITGGKDYVESAINILIKNDELRDYKIINQRFAFHSSLLEPFLDEFLDQIKDIAYAEVEIPYPSNLTAHWMKKKDLSAEYWVRHFRQMVNFRESVNKIVAEIKDPIFIEIGPENVLLPLVKRQASKQKNSNFIGFPSVVNALGQCWKLGVKVNWEKYFSCDSRQRIPLPSYQFNRKKFDFYMDQESDSKSFFVEKMDQSQRGDVTSANAVEMASSVNIRQQILTVWQKHFGRDDIHFFDNFFELGGDSLLAGQIISEINKNICSNVDFKLIFNYPTVNDLALMIKKEHLLVDGEASVAIPQVPRVLSEDRFYFDASSAQYRMWFLSQLGGNHNMILHNRFYGKINKEAFDKTIALLIKKHESLRTNFVFKDKLFQCVHPLEVADHFSVDYRKLTVSDQELEDLIYSLTTIPFNFEEGFLFKVVFVERENDLVDLFIIIHHIITDGWSMGVVQKDIGILYNQILSGNETLLEPMDFQYVDFTSYQQKLFTSKLYCSQKESLLKRLNNIIVSEVATDYPRKEKQTFDGATLFFDIDPERMKKISQILTHSKSSLYIFWVSILGLLISGYTEKLDVQIGSPIACRTKKEFSDIIGFFVNTLIVKLKVTPGVSYMEFLKSCTAEALDVFEYQDVPFDEIISALNLKRDLSRSALFQVRLAVHNTPFSLLNIEGIDPVFSIVDMGKKTARYDFELHVFNSGDNMTLQLIYNVDLFSEETMTRFLSDINFIVDQAIDNPAVNVNDLRCNDFRKEKHDVSVVDVFQPICVQHIFEKNIQKYGNIKAVVSSDHIVTHSKLNDLSNHLAIELRQYEKCINDKIAIFLPDGIEQIVAILAVLKLSSCFIPVDTNWPEARIKFILEDSKAKVIISKKDLAEKLAFTNIKKFYVSDSVFEGATSHDLSLIQDDIKYSEHDPAYIIYTSGSEGLPKGVAISHANLIQYVSSISKMIDLSVVNQLMNLGAYSTDFWYTTFLFSICFGKTLHIVNDTLRYDGIKLAQYLESNHIDFMKIVPSHFKALHNDKNKHGLIPSKILMFAGEKLSVSLFKKVASLSGACKILNSYGPTETSIAIMIADLDCYKSQVLPEGIDSMPIGHLLSNNFAYLLDADMRKLGETEEGFLAISGLSVGMGYVNYDQTKGVKFLKNRFNLDYDKRYKDLYLTGDVVKRLSDGSYVFIDRKDSEIKLDGHRINTTEISNLIEKVEDVRASVVLKVEGNDENRPLLNAYIELRELESHEEWALVNERINEWTLLFDVTYTNKDINADVLNDYSGWVSSYTRKDYDLKHMQEWTALSIENITSLSPRRILELGCGTGLLLLRLLPVVDSYDACDISRVCVDSLSSYLKSQDVDSKVKLWVGGAHQFELARKNYYDTVIINSVIQKFPSLLYLEQVITFAMASLGDKGKIFLGDLRNFNTVDEFYLSCLLCQDNSSAQFYDLNDYISSRRYGERELVIHPAYFIAIMDKFESIIDVRLQAKSGILNNEMNLFRYDAVLFIDKSNSKNRSSKKVVCFNLSEVDLALSALSVEQAVLIRGASRQLIRDLHGLSRDSAAKIEDIFIEGEKNVKSQILREDGSIKKLIEMANSCGCSYMFIPSLDEGSKIDVLLYKGDLSDISFKDLYHASNNMQKNLSTQPLYRDYCMKVNEKISTELRQYLPHYMIPKRVIFLENFPRLSSGKIDIKRLPFSRMVRKNKQKEDGESLGGKKIISILIDLISRFLNLEKAQIKSSDNFFNLGGDSIIAIQLITALSHLGYELKIDDIFMKETLGELASSIKRSVSNKLAILNDSIMDCPVVTTIAQFVAENKIENITYNQGLLCQLDRSISYEKIKFFIEKLVEHNEVFRQRFFLEESGGVTIKILPYLKGLEWVKYKFMEVHQINDAFLLDASIELNHSIDAINGPLMALGYYATPDVAYIQIIAHHVAVDPVSWRLIFQSLELAFSRGMDRDSFPEFLYPSYQKVASQFNVDQLYDRSLKNIDYWLDEVSLTQPYHDLLSAFYVEESKSKMSLPVGLNKNFKTYHYTVNDSLSNSLKDLSKLLNASTHDLLLSHFLLTIKNNIDACDLNIDSFSVHIESHGRSVEGIPDLNETLGWFTTFYPQKIQIDKLRSLKSSIHYLKQKANTLANNAFEFGVLKYLGKEPLDEKVLRLRKQPNPLILFNYLGNILKGVGNHIRFLDKIYSNCIDPDLTRPHALFFEPGFVNGKLMVNVMYDSRLYEEANIALLVGQFVDLLDLNTGRFLFDKGI